MGEPVIVKLAWIICATTVALSMVGLLGWAMAHGYGVEALLTLVGSVLIGYMNLIHAKVTAATTPPASPAKPQAPPPDAGA